jgi:hypothetical protein
MRALTVIVILSMLLLAGPARADSTSGARMRTAGAALIIIGSAVIVAGGAVALTGLVQGGGGIDSSSSDYWMMVGGGAMVGTGALALGIGIPLYISGTAEVDRARTGRTASLMEVRF